MAGPAGRSAGALRGALARASGGEVVVGAIVIALVALMAWLVVQAMGLERARDRTATRAMRDYASIAAWRFASAASQELHDLAAEMAARLAETRAVHDSMPRVDVLFPVVDASSRPSIADGVRVGFRVDLRDGGVAFAGGSPPAGLKRWLLDSLPRRAGYGGRDPHRATSLTLGGRRWMVPYRVFWDDARPGVIYGLLVEEGAVARRFAAVHRATEMLPPAIAGPVPQDRSVALRVLDASGGVVFASGAVDGRYLGVDSIAPEDGALRVEASLDARLATSPVLAGGAPIGVRGAAGLLALALALALVAVVQLQRSRELARLREEFVANVSHELRTPLTQISLFGETLMRDRERSADEKRHFAGVIFREARRLTTLVESILRFSGRGTRGAVALSPLRLDAELAEAVETFRPIAAAADVRVLVDVPAGLGVMADGAALRQVVLNLLDNAVKYGPEGQAVRVSAAADGPRILLRIDDEGPGIPAEQRRRVFESFVRLQAPGRPNVAGTGIGLAVVRELAQSMGGWASAEAAPGGGTRMVVALTAVAEDREAPHAARQASRAGAGSAP